jgi:hypothetical protein
MKYIPLIDQIEDGKYYLVYDSMQVQSNIYPFSYKGILLVLCDYKKDEKVEVVFRIGIADAYEPVLFKNSITNKKVKHLTIDVNKTRILKYFLNNATALFELSEDEVTQNIILNEI